MKLDDYIDYHVLFMTMSIIIAYKYITKDEKNIIIEKKNSE